MKKKSLQNVEYQSITKVFELESFIVWTNLMQLILNDVLEAQFEKLSEVQLTLQRNFTHYE